MDRSFVPPARAGGLGGGLRRVSPALAAALFLCFLGPNPTLAQEGPERDAGEPRATGRDSARVVGQVVSAVTGEPLGGASISLRGSRSGAISDSTGRFSLPSTPSGHDTLDVRYVGYESGFVEVYLEPARTTRLVLLLSPTTVRLAELEVEIPRRNPGAVMLEGFRRRMNRGMGTFFDREDIERRNPRSTSDLLRGVQGLRVAPHQGIGRTQVTVGRSGTTCRPEIFVDGLHLAGASVDDVIVPDLGGVEVYPGPALVPARFAAMAPTQCGAIIIWTRRGQAPDQP